MIDVFDRVVQYPGRYRLKEVSGQAGVFDLVPAPGTVTEPGTPINKDLLDWLKYNMSSASFMAFVSSVDANVLDAALGKGKTATDGRGVGLALAQYAWFKGVSRDVYPFTRLVMQDTITDCYANALIEMLSCTQIMDLIKLSPYASSQMYSTETVRKWKKDYDTMSLLVRRPEIVDTIREQHWDIWKEGWQTYTARGPFTFTVPDGITCLTVEVIGAGGTGVSQKNPGASGEYVLSCLPVTPGQIIHGSIPVPGTDTIFGSLHASTGGGVTGTPTQSGKFLKVGTAGGSDTDRYYAGGSAGYGGGDGTAGGKASNGGATGGSAGVGTRVLPLTEGTGGAGQAGGGGAGGGGGPWVGGSGGGAGYGGGGGYSNSAGGAGGSGCVVVYM